jgi:hypothetical protein
MLDDAPPTPAVGRRLLPDPSPMPGSGLAQRLWGR